MIKYNGRPVYEDIVTGKIYWYPGNKNSIVKHTVVDIAKEEERLENALLTAREQLKQLYEKTAKKAGEEHAIIFEIHGMILEDDDFLSVMKESIALGNCAETAVISAKERFKQKFDALNDGYLKERSADVEDIAQRLLWCLSGKKAETIALNEPVILLAEEILPSQMAMLEQKDVLAIVTRKGSVNSHAAILAKGRKIPMIVNVEIPDAQNLDGRDAIVNAVTGEFIIEPSQEEVIALTEQKERWQKECRELLALKGKENITGDGRSIKIYANIGNAEEAQEALLADAGGIGLFRSEFLFLERANPPTEEEQMISYRTVLQKMADKKVIIRTLDIGADKQVTYLQAEQEMNPALGQRGIRLYLKYPELLTTQLRAIYRASIYGNAAIMFPMIVSVEEVIELKKTAKQVKEQLAREGYEIREIPLGIMIETPAAALMAEELAKEADFFSIGTNDLIQYTLAIDRQNSKLNGYCNQLHPSVLRLIEMAVRGAHKEGIPVGICGELAGDTTMTESFLTMGVDELSVTPSRILKVRKAVRDI